MSWQEQLRGDPLPWLLEDCGPGVRYLALRDLLDAAPEDEPLRTARRAAHGAGEIPKILEKMDPAGFWVKPGPGYGPKYHSTVWSIILLAQLGAAVAEDARIQVACDYLLDHALSSIGSFSYSGAPSGTIDCLHGNLCWALRELGCEDARLATAYDWLARSVTGEGISPMTEKRAPVRFYAYKCGPDFACGANNGLPCAWGAVKVMLALGKAPAAQRTPMWQRAVEQGSAFLLGVDPASAAYPTGYSDKPSSSWWKFGFPVFYVTDVLQIVEALVALDHGRDPRLAHALQIIREKQDAAGRWPLEYDYTSKTWAYLGRKGQPSPWVTLRALRVLKAVG